MKIPVYRGEDKLFTRNAPGTWWSPDSGFAENFARINQRQKKGLKKLNPSKVMKGSLDIDDYAYGVKKSMVKHGEDGVMKRYKKGLNESFNQVDKDVENLKKGKLSTKKFTDKYWETLLPSGKAAKPTIDFLKTIKPIGKALKPAMRFLGPLAAAYGAYEYLQGSPAGKGSQLDNTIDYSNGTMVYTNGPLAKSKKR